MRQVTEHESKSQSSSRGKGRGRSRSKKKLTVESETTNHEVNIHTDDQPVETDTITLDLEADITQLEAPTFSTLNKGPPEPMLRLRWDHKTHLIGEKVINPMIHCCDKCEAPILTYGRMIPCKHVFCLACAEKHDKACPRCQEKILRIEKTGLGTVFMCTFGGTRYGNTGCRRTYLSQRDLQAHINHRHVSGTTIKGSSTNVPTTSSLNPTSSASSCLKPTVTNHTTSVTDSRGHMNSNNEHHKIHHSASSYSSSSQSLLRQSHHPNYMPRHSEQYISANSVVQRQRTSPSQRNSSLSTVHQPLQPPEFLKQLMISSGNVMSNVTPTEMTKSKVEPVSSTITNFHQNFSPLFLQTSPPVIPLPVPPPGQPSISPVVQPQYFSPNPMTTYPASLPQVTVPQFSPSSPTQPLITQPQIIPASTQTAKIPQYPQDSVMQPFSVPPPPPHPWFRPSSQTNFY